VTVLGHAADPDAGGSEGLGQGLGARLDDLRLVQGMGRAQDQGVEHLQVMQAGMELLFRFLELLAFLEHPPEAVEAGDRPDPGQELHAIEGLGQEVVGSHLQALDPRLAVIQSRQQDDGHLGQHGILAQGAADLVAVHARQQDVQQHEIRQGLARRLQGRGAIVAERDRMAFRQEHPAQQSAGDPVVVDDEDVVPGGRGVLGHA
jgi:hypothetical protein